MMRLRPIALVLVVIAGAIAWSLAIRTRGYDYDEVQRAHSIWMTSQDLRPYHDFLECHPPYFALLAPLARIFPDPASLLPALRVVAAVGNLLFLAGLAIIAGMGEGGEPLAAILGTALVAFYPDVLAFLAEFRIDGWGYALAIWSLVGFLRSSRPWRTAGLGVGTGLATLLLCPKVALLPPLVVAFDQVAARRPWKSALRAIALYVAGLGAAGAIVWLWLTANGIDIRMGFAFLVRYQVLSDFHSGFGRGLLRAISQIPVLYVPLLAAFAIWVARRVRARSLSAPYLPALALWLLAQAMLVSYPYKQYFGLWFLLASSFFPSLFHVLKRSAGAVFLGLCALSVSLSVVTAHGWRDGRVPRNEEYVLRIMNEIADPGDRVVAAPPFHPIFRRDTFYVWFNTLDPSGYETEEIMGDIPLVRGLASERTYREELEANPPALVAMLDGVYPRLQSGVIEEFLRERRYVASRVAGVVLAIRPDRVERLRRLQSDERDADRGVPR